MAMSTRSVEHVDGEADSTSSRSDALRTNVQRSDVLREDAPRVALQLDNVHPHQLFRLRSLTTWDQLDALEAGVAQLDEVLREVQVMRATCALDITARKLR
ncbi:MAG: hypothetical protein AAFQ42_14960 [Pseudomonadota bacterium]